MVQNRAIRCIHRLNWDSPSIELSKISGLIPIKAKLMLLDVRYKVKAIRYMPSNRITHLRIYKVIISHQISEFDSHSPVSFSIRVLCLFRFCGH